MQEIEFKIETIYNFVSAYEKRKYEVMIKGGTLLSPVCFMVDYCTKLRSEGVTKNE